MTSTSPHEPDPDAAAPGRARDLGLFAAVWVPYAALVRHFWFVSDDAYISFRYSRNWGRGLGIVFNPGESPPAEGYSNFLMVAAGAAVEALGLDMQFWLPLACALCGSLLLWLVLRTLTTRFAVGPVPAFLATATLAWSAPFAVWSTSALETMPYALLFFATLERLALRRGGAAGATAGLLATLLALTRVEGIAWAVLVFPALTAISRRVSGERVLAPLVRYGVVLAVLYGGYFAWRWSYFGHAWPMTVYAKVGFTGERLARGFDYLFVQFATTLSLLAIVPGTLAALRPGRGRGRLAAGLVVAAVPVGVLLYTALVGGDWMTFSRFLVPALSFVALGFGLALSDVGKVGACVLGGAAAVLGVLPGFDVHLVPESVRAAHHFRLNTDDYRSEHAQWEFMRFNGIRWSVQGEVLREVCPPGSTVVMGAIGATSYVSDLVTLDRHGFVTPAVALRDHDASAELRSPGHDTVVEPGWFVEHGYDPDYLLAKLHEEDGRAGMARQLRTSAGRLQRAGLDDRYVVELVRLAGSERWFVILWTRIPAGRAAADAWRDFEQDLARLLAGGEVREVDVAPPTDRVPGLPDWF